MCVLVFEAAAAGSRCHGRLPLTGEAIALGIAAITQRYRGSTPRDFVFIKHHRALLFWDCSLPHTRRRRGERNKINLTEREREKECGRKERKVFMNPKKS